MYMKHQRVARLTLLTLALLVRSVKPNFIQFYRQRIYFNDSTADAIGYDEKTNENATQTSSPSISETLADIYTDCVLGLSFSCLQRKAIEFLNRLNEIKQINLLSDFLSIVKRNDNEPRFTDRYSNAIQFVTAIDDIITRFFETHIIRVQPPAFFEIGAKKYRAAIDLDFNNNFGNDNPVEARQKKKKKMYGGLLAFAGVLMCMKIIAVIGLKALKALLLATVSVTISKIMLLKKAQGSGSHGGHESSGHRNWDRRMQETPSPLPYFTYPPTE